jgi:uncharacterized protein YecE (DUF72 family)
MSAIRIGISGWRYSPWRGVFYPRDLPQRLELWYASRILPAIEINGSFYSLQRPEYFQCWYEETPGDFVFAVKGPRFITHMKRVRDVARPLANFLASGLFNLREKLGPILWQFPANFRYDRATMASFFELLPHDTRAALRLARKRDHRLKGRARLAIDANRPMRHAVEIRHESFLDADFVALLRDHGIALVTAETAGKWPMTYDVTADFLYLRLHGDKELYRSGYSDRSLERWSKRIEAWSGGAEPAGVKTIVPQERRASRARDVYCFFDNTDAKLRAPIDAQSLMRKLHLQPGAMPAADPSKPYRAVGSRYPPLPPGSRARA